MSNISLSTLRGHGDEELLNAFNRLARAASMDSFRVSGMRANGVRDENLLCGATFIHRSRALQQVAAAREEAEAQKETKSSRDESQLGIKMSRDNMRATLAGFLRVNLSRVLKGRCYQCGKSGHEKPACRADVRKMQKACALFDCLPQLVPYLVALEVITTVPQLP